MAENSENHKQAIQKGIEYPDDQYGSVKKAVDKLEELGYIKSKQTLSQKKVEIKEYECTELGVFYALARNPNANTLRILEGYESRIEFCKSFKALYNVWGHDHFAMFLRDIGEFLPMVRKKGVEVAVPYLLMKIMRQTRSLDKKTRKKNVRAVFKQYPHTKQMLKEWRKNIDEVL